MDKNIYWKDALKSDDPIVLKKGKAGYFYKCGEATVFWHGQESLAAQQALTDAAEDAARAAKATSSGQCPRCHVVFTNAGCRCAPGFM